MNKKFNKKGFTIVELVIVIAVIAILAAVLIPTFSNMVQKANRSADQQAIRQMNTVLAAEAVTNDMTIFDVFAVLEENGLSAKDYKALGKDMSFFYDAEINRVLYVDNTGKAVYPEEYENRTTNGKWQSLTMQIVAEQPADYANSGTTVKVKSGNELVYVVEQIKDKKSSATTIQLSQDIDMMGAAFDFGVDGVENLTIEGTAANPVVIKNATAVQAAKTYANGGEGNDGTYNMGLVAKAKNLTIKNVVIENMNLKDTNGSNCAFLVGILSGTLTLDNVTIKNSSLIGHHDVGALIGASGSGAKLNATNVIIENVTIEAVGGRVGKLIGRVQQHMTITGEDQVTMTNVTMGIYECDANSGSYDGKTLGLSETFITSTEIESSGEKTVSTRVYFEDSLIGTISSDVTKYGIKETTSAPSATISKVYNDLKALVK